MGVYDIEKHRLSNTKLFNIWSGMKSRCDNKNHPSYKNYGGRGITYDEKWKEFNNFYNDMKEGYKEGLSIDRIDVNGNYSKENCRWADRITQCNNKRNNVFYNYKGKKLTVHQLSDEYNIHPSTIRSRLRKGMTIEQAIEIPLNYANDFY